MRVLIAACPRPSASLQHCQEEQGRCLSYSSTVAFECALKIWLIHQWTKLISGQVQKLYMYIHIYMCTPLNIPRSKLLWIYINYLKLNLSFLAHFLSCIYAWKFLQVKRWDFIERLTMGFHYFGTATMKLKKIVLYLWLPFEKFINGISSQIYYFIWATPLFAVQTF